MMLMEDNSAYLSNRMWWKILPSMLIGDIFVLLTFQFGTFLLVSKCCPPGEFIVFSALQFFLLTIALLDCFFAIAAPQLFSRYKGASDHLRAQEIFSEALTLQLALTGTVFLLCFFNMDKIVAFLNISEDLRKIAFRYGRWLILSCLMQSICNLLKNFIRSDSLPKVATAISIADCIVYFSLIFYWIGLRNTSVVAIPIAAVITAAMSMMCCLWSILMKQSTIRLHFQWMRRKTFQELITLAGNGLITNTINIVFGIFLARWILSTFGGKPMTIFAANCLLMNVSTALSNGFILGTQFLTSVFYGEKNKNGIIFVFRKGIRLGVLFQLGLLIPCLIFAARIAAWMNIQENFSGEAALVLRISAVTCLVRFFYHFFIGFYNVSGHSTMAMTCSTVNYWFINSCSWLFFIFMIRSEKWFWFALPVSWLLMLAIVLITALFKKIRCHHENILLLFRLEHVPLSYYFLLRDDVRDLDDYSAMLELFLKKHQVSMPNMARVKHLFEEIFLFAGERGNLKKNRLFSVLTTLWEDRIELTLKYESAQSCLDSILNGKQENLPPERLAGAKMLMRFSDEIYIDQIYGCNFIRLTLHR